LLHLLCVGLRLRLTFSKELLGLLRPLCCEFNVFFVLLELEALDVVVDVLLLVASVLEELVVGLLLLEHDNRVDHLRGHLLHSHDRVHLYLRVKLELLEGGGALQDLLLVHLFWLVSSILLADLLGLLLELFALLWVHHVHLKGLGVDLLWHLQLLVQSGIEAALSNRFHSNLPDKGEVVRLLVLLVLELSLQLAALLHHLVKDGLHLLHTVLKGVQLGLQEIIKGHSLV